MRRKLTSDNKSLGGLSSVMSIILKKKLILKKILWGSLIMSHPQSRTKNDLSRALCDLTHVQTPQENISAINRGAYVWLNKRQIRKIYSLCAKIFDLQTKLKCLMW